MIASMVGPGGIPGVITYIAPISADGRIFAFGL